MADVDLKPRGAVRGVLRVPGDKSVSHRALLFGAFARGVTRARGLAPGADVRSSRGVVEALGIAVRDEGDAVLVAGRGWDGLHRDPAAPPLGLDCGNSGTTTRLALGLLAGGRGRFLLHGDASLSRRPMRRVAEPLARLGARLEERDTLPLVVEGAPLRGARVETGVASAQVKSALVLAALQADGPSVVVEPEPTRDHTERLLRAMGVPLGPVTEDGRARAGLTVPGGAPPAAPLEITIPGDPSSAAFFVALACLSPGSELRVENVLLNPGRIGFYRLLARMGADVAWHEEVSSPEPCGTIVARGGALRGVEVGAHEVVDAIDELPLLAVCGALAEGPTTIRGAAELRVKESDRIAATVALLRAFGAQADELPDGLALAGGARPRGAAVDARHDHRIAMCAAVMAARASSASRLGGAEWVRVSWPAFFDELERLAPEAAR